MPPTSTSSPPLVTLEVFDDVARVTLRSPRNRNALSSALLADLHRALDGAGGADVRTLVLDHEPPAFCAGADLRERTTAPPDARTASPAGLTPMAEAMARLMEWPVPTIAAVKGPARAGGIGLLASCDLVVVDPTVDFAFTEVRIGVAPAIISVPILRRVAWSAVAAAFLTGERFDAHEARRIGLVTHVSDDVDATVAGLCDGIRAGGAVAVAATKRLLHGGPDGAATLRADLARLGELSDALFASEEAQARMRAFLNP